MKLRHLLQKAKEEMKGHNPNDPRYKLLKLQHKQGMKELLQIKKLMS